MHGPSTFLYKQSTWVTRKYDILVQAKNTGAFMKGDGRMIMKITKDYRTREKKLEVWREKVNAWKGKAKTTICEGVYWCEQHMEIVTIVVPVAGIAVGQVCKSVARTAAIKQDDRKRNLEVWDPVNGFRWQLKRKMTNNEKLILDSRHRNGESIGDILYDMKLLK